MQKLAPLIIIAMMTWLSSTAHAQPADYIIQSNAAPLNPLIDLPPALQRQLDASAPASVVSRFNQSSKQVRIALLLPTESKTLGDAAYVVRVGFAAAAAVEGGADVIYVDAQQNNIVDRYRSVVAAGAQVIVGPLTRQGIAAIAPDVTVPTLALNSLDPGQMAISKLLSLSLALEGEARQMVRVMRDDGRVNPLVVGTNDALSQRLAQAFVDEWRRQTEQTVPVIHWPVETSPPPTAFSEAIAQTDSVFVALEAPDAAALKALLPSDRVVYATSQVNTRTLIPALAGVRFIDMPWFLMREQAEVKRYPRPAVPMTLSTERLYALGIDAYRLAVLMAASTTVPASLSLHGVTGDLKLGRDHQFVRLLPLAVMMSGPVQ